MAVPIALSRPYRLYYDYESDLAAIWWLGYKLMITLQIQDQKRLHIVSVPPYKVLFLTFYLTFRTLAWYILLTPFTRTSGPIVPPISGESSHMLCVLKPVSAVGTSCWHRKVSRCVETMKFDVFAVTATIDPNIRTPAVAQFLACFLLGNSPAPKFYMPTFRNTLFHLHRQVDVSRMKLG